VIALVLAGSLGATHEMWDPQLEAFEARFRKVVTYDHPGHGGASVPQTPITLDDLGRHVLALLDERELDRVSFCGLSLGGMVGMWLASRAPERIERLVLACTSARFAPPERWRERAATVRAHGLEAIADAALERWFTPAFEDRARYREMFVSNDPEGYARCCEAIAVADLRDDVGAIRAPTLVIAGDQDPSVPREDTQLLAEGIPDARVVTLPAAHLASVERPTEFADAVLEHLVREEER
jgi:3-oxoadipate enol-lactonase